MLRPVARLRLGPIPGVWTLAARPGGRCFGPLAVAPSTAASGAPAGLARCSEGVGGPLLRQRRSATTAFTVKARPGEEACEQTLFVVGLNEGKFFGQDGGEEALKLLERIVEHEGPKYNLLFSLTERELQKLQDDHLVKNNKLTPSRELESVAHGEFVPIIQAGMIDKCGRRALGRVLRTTQAHVAWLLWKHPREARKVYWAFWKRKEMKNAAGREFWMKHFPTSAYAYFEEHAELCVIRTAELLSTAQKQGKTTTWVLVVSNKFYQPVVERLNLMLDETAPEKLGSLDFSRHLRERATELCADVPDLTPMLVFAYLGLPILFLYGLLFDVQGMYYKIYHEQLFPKEFRD